MSETENTAGNVPVLLKQLAEAREKLRDERAAVKPRMQEAERLHREAQATRKRVRQAAARYWKRIRAQAAQSLKPIEAARSELVQQQEELARSFAELSAEREQFASDSAEARRQLQQSWELLRIEQNQFSTEREAREQELSRLFQLLDQREREVTVREQKVKTDRQTADKELALIRAEITGLDQRVVRARLLLQELEQQRARQVAEQVTGTAARVPELVALATSDLYSPQQLSAWELREEEIRREQNALAIARRELEKLAEHLTDQRQVLAEQYQNFATAKQAWQLAETRTVDELEQIARAVEAREEMLQTRDQAAERMDENRRERERELWKYQTTLDRWHQLLQEREMRFLADRERADAGLVARRKVVADREAGLDFVCQKWEAEHQRASEQWLEVIASYHEDRKTCAAMVQECERTRRQTQEQAAKLAAWLVAVEQQAQEVKGERVTRRIRVLRKRWEGRFTRMLRQFDERLNRLQVESNTLVKRHEKFQTLAAELTQRQRQQLAQERRREKGVVVQAEQLSVEEPAILLTAVDHWRQRSDAEVVRLRTAANLAANALLNADAKQNIVMLKPARAA